MNSNRIMIVDDNARRKRALADFLGAAGYNVATARDADQALARIAYSPPRLVIVDLDMEGMDGMSFYDEIDRRFPTLSVVIVAEHGTVPEAVDATKRGVFDFLTPPVDNDRLHQAVEAAMRPGIGAVAGRPAGPKSTAQWRSEIITQSPVMEQLLQQAQRVAETDASVLIQSDSGTGKELLARAVHKASRRRDRPFVAINCSAIPETLLESELFGHTKGAFTGATRSHEGVFQRAHGGTLFLDEIGDMSPMLQAALLRVLQEKEVRPVGSTDVSPADVRVICATHSDLDAAIAAGGFRKDLFYRLNVVTLTLPMLAQRREDIPLLVRHFSRQLAQQNGGTVKRFSQEALELLLNAPWPGNVRQLRNIVERTHALATSLFIPPSLVADALDDFPSRAPSLAQQRDECERDYLAQLLRMSQGNVSHAARLAQRNRTEFYRLLRRYHIKPADFRLQ